LEQVGQFSAAVEKEEGDNQLGRSEKNGARYSSQFCNFKSGS
jgi:hypothetical protein